MANAIKLFSSLYNFLSLFYNFQLLVKHKSAENGRGDDLGEFCAESWMFDLGSFCVREIRVGSFDGKVT
jgi:hypothetical protein